MKFQNSILKFVWTDGGRTDEPKAIYAKKNEMTRDGHLSQIYEQP